MHIMHKKRFHTIIRRAWSSDLGGGKKRTSERHFYRIFREFRECVLFRQRNFASSVSLIMPLTLSKTS